MSERNPNCKRDIREFEASSTSVSPLKKKKNLDDSSTDSHVAIPSSVLASTADSAPGGCSFTSVGEVGDDQSSSICSSCFSIESNEIARNSSSSVVDLEAHQVSEIKSSKVITRNFRQEENPVSEALGETVEMGSSSPTERDNPTPAEIDAFFTELENDEKQKRFTEKYNFDIVNDKPLQGRYKWDLIINHP